jgi:mRNA-degrading endonuclease YafQ of YafQ-DinJ toxin-antitoxin module
MKIVFYPLFQRSYKRLDRQMQLLADEKIAIFDRDFFDPRLHTHQLHGQLKNIWSFSTDARHRVLFVFLDDARQSVAFVDIGTHRLYS